jgi:hypothetical protein
MTQILEHFLPNTELNLPNLKAFVQSLENSALDNPITPSASDGITPSYPIVSPQSTAPDSVNESSDITNEISELYQEVGRVRVDSKGVQSEYTIHAAYRLTMLTTSQDMSDQARHTSFTLQSGPLNSLVSRILQIVTSLLPSQPHPPSLPHYPSHRWE